jgi:hypothetical protein
MDILSRIDAWNQASRSPEMASKFLKADDTPEKGLSTEKEIDMYRERLTNAEMKLAKERETKGEGENGL